MFYCDLVLVDCANVQGTLDVVLSVSFFLAEGIMHSTARFLPASFLYYSWPFWGRDLHWPVEWGALLAAAESTMFLVFPYCSVCGDTLGSLLCHLRPGMIVLVNAYGFHPFR